MAAAEVIKPAVTGLTGFADRFDVQAHQRSCTNVIAEPCVNKATSLLQKLKTKSRQAAKSGAKRDQNRTKHSTYSLQKATVSGTEKRAASTDNNDVGCTTSRTATPRPILVQRHTLHSGGVRGEVGLRVEGVSTGTTVEKLLQESTSPTTTDNDDIITVAIALVNQLEEDRLQTLASLSEERRKVWELGIALDAETEKRLDLIPRAVQAEHEECHCNVLELKWHVLFQQRQLTRLREELKGVAVKNAALKKDTDKLATNCPLLEEKLLIERDHMSDIASRQKETSDQLSRAQHKLSHTEDRSSLAHSKAATERRSMEEELERVRERLTAASVELKLSQSERAKLDHKSSDCRSRIKDNQRQASHLLSQSDKSRARLTVVKEKAGALREEHARMDAARTKVVAENERLTKKKDSEHAALKCENTVLLSELQAAQSALRKARDNIEDMEQNIDLSKETITACVKQTHDDDKSVERAHRELGKLDQQMGISVSQFTKVKEDNFTHKEEFKSEEARTGDIEHSLRSTVSSLQYQLQQETKTKTAFQAKVEQHSAELGKLKVEQKQQLQQTQRVAEASETQSKGKTDMVDKLQKLLEEKRSEVASLRCQLSEVQEEHCSIEANLGGRRDQLRPQEQRLREEVQERVSKVNEVSDKIKQLERRLEDVLKSTTMVGKMDKDTKAAIVTLNERLAVMTEKLAEEQRVEESWKQEYQEIADFSSEAEDKYTAYLTERGELVKQCQLDLEEGLAGNGALSRLYRRLQSQLVESKRLALATLERRLEQEAALRDHKQLVSFQLCVYAAMCEHYQQREAASHQTLQRLHSDSQLNMAQLRSLHTKLQSLISLLQDFLAAHERDKLSLRRRSNGGAGGGRRELETPCVS